MIIFYDKQTGDIKGTVDGRTHSEAHLKMGMENCDRIIVQWKPLKWFDKEGNEVPNDALHPETLFPLAVAADFTPDVTDEMQNKIFFEIDANSREVYKYKVDLKTKTLILK